MEKGISDPEEESKLEGRAAETARQGTDGRQQGDQA